MSCRDALLISTGDYAKAIDAYLRLNTDQTSDYDFLEEMWEKVAN